MEDKYKNLTSFIYQDLAWGHIYRKKDGEVIKDGDNNAEKYILDSLKIMKIDVKDLKDKKIFNIGTGRESRFFASHGAAVTHIDIGDQSVSELKDWAKKNNKKVESQTVDIADAEIGENKYDIIFLSGIYQHIKAPAYALVKFINALKKDGLMYMGFYRSGEFKYFIIDAIRSMIGHDTMSIARDINAILFTFGEFNHYQSSRIMDDFYVPRKHNFHPQDVIDDINLLGGDVFNFDNDFRDYNHDGHSYFSIGGDRIYITKKNDQVTKLGDVEKKLKSTKGRNQITEVKYTQKIINENIFLINKIKTFYETGFVNKTNMICLCLGMYQFTRPYVFENSYYFQESKKQGRHEILNIYLKNFIDNFSHKR